MHLWCILGKQRQKMVHWCITMSTSMKAITACTVTTFWILERKQLDCSPHCCHNLEKEKEKVCSMVQGEFIFLNQIHPKPLFILAVTPESIVADSKKNPERFTKNKHSKNSLKLFQKDYQKIYRAKSNQWASSGMH